MQSKLALSYCNNSSSDKMKDLESNIDAMFNFYCKVDMNVVLQDQFFLESVYSHHSIKRNVLLNDLVWNFLKNLY